MFKRVEKRRKKREEEEELGLDEDMKDVLGIQDTDSDESDSESDPNEAGGDSEREVAAENQRQDTGDEDEEGTSEGDGDPKRPTRTVKEALEEPLYIISLQPDVKGCIICPGKLLKNDQIANVHKLSNAHTRRFKLFAELTADARPDENAWDVLQNDVTSKYVKTSSMPTEQTSKRAEKRKAKLAAINAKRDRQRAMKAKAKAKKVANITDPSSTATASPSKAVKLARKKKKVDHPGTVDASRMKPSSPVA